MDVKVRRHAWADMGGMSDDRDRITERRYRALGTPVYALVSQRATAASESSRTTLVSATSY